MSDTETIWLVVAGVLGLVVVLFIAYLVGSTARSRPTGGGRHRAPTKTRPHRDTFRTELPEPEPKKRAAIITANASPELRAELTSQSIVAGWDEPLWLEADEVASAAAAAREALDAAVDVVCVRGDAAIDRGAVSVLAHTEMPVAFLPSRPPAPDQLDPLGQGEPEGDKAEHPHESVSHTRAAGVDSESLAAAMKTALTGQNSRVDIGRASLAPAELTGAPEDPPEPVSRDIVFLHSLVFGDIIPEDEPTLSAKVVTKSLFSGTSITTTVKPDDEEAVTRRARSLAFSTRLSPAAGEEARSGALDGYLHASQSVKGWTGVARAMMRRASRPTPLLVPMRSVAFTVTLDKPAEITVDGHSIGLGNPGESTVWVDPLALVVRR